MGQSPPWKANNCSVSQEISCNLLNPKINYCILESIPLAPIFSQMNPVPLRPTLTLSLHLVLVDHIISTLSLAGAGIAQCGLYRGEVGLDSQQEQDVCSLHTDSGAHLASCRVATEEAKWQGR